MRKLLSITLSLALFTPSLAQAEFLKDMKFSGEVLVQMISVDNGIDFSAATNDQTGLAHTRVLVGADFDLLDDVSARVTLVKNNRAWGDTCTAGFCSGPSTGLNTGTEDVDSLTANIGVDEAWFKVENLMMDNLNLTMGRQYYGNPGDLIVYFGPSREPLPGTLATSSIDVAKLEHMGDSLSFTGIAGKLSDAVTVGVTAFNTDIDLQGVELGFKGLPVDLGLFAYRRLRHDPANNPTKGDELFVPGLRLKGDMDDFFYSLTAAMNFGKDRFSGTTIGAGQSYDGWGLLAKAGLKFNLEGMAMLKPSVEYGRGTGDDPSTGSKNEGFRTINSDYKPGELVGLAYGATFLTGGYSTYNTGLLNTSVWSVGVEAVPEAAPKLTASLRYWDSEPVEAAGTFSPITVENRELDLRLAWAHSENVTLSAVLADGGPTGIFRTNSARLYKSEVAVRF